MRRVLDAWRTCLEWLKVGYHVAPESYRNVPSHNMRADIAWAQKPGKTLEDQGLSDAPAGYLDDSTARAARRLIDFMGS